MTLGGVGWRQKFCGVSVNTPNCLQENLNVPT